LFADEDFGVANWILQKRLERCRSDIETAAFSMRSLSDIAFSWGFSDASHFSRAFRKHYGVSPKACRVGTRLSTLSAPNRAQQNNN
jgi:AraC-like DNA-binding protein